MANPKTQAKKVPVPMTTAQAIGKLKFFNKKIELLRRGSFYKSVFAKERCVTVTISGTKPVKVTKRGPNENDLLACVTTLRMFVQEKDGISLRQIVTLYQTFSDSPMCIQSAQQVQNGVESYLDQAAGIIAFSEPITNRRLFDLFMYGDLAHGNEDKRQEYEAWIETVNKPLLEQMFEQIVIFLIRAVQSFYCMNQRTIYFLETGAPSDDFKPAQRLHSPKCAVRRR